MVAHFNNLPVNASSLELRQFVVDNFDAPGSELDYPLATDWKPNIQVFDKINNPEMKAWAFIIHSKWQTLLRKFNPDKLCQGCVSSHLHLKNSFVVPGGRFREFYYWDTFWILHGLLISEMNETAKGVLLNFLDIVEYLGYIPNGSRIYYLNRSQPPMLTQMVNLYVEKTSDVEILAKALPLLDKEYLFWMHYRTVDLGPHTNGDHYLLNRYYVDSAGPRPESHLEDIHLARSFNTEDEKYSFYKNVCSAAESGWDFSSRWFQGPKYSTSSLLELKKKAEDKQANLEEYVESLESFPSNMTFAEISAMHWPFEELSFHASPSDLSDLRSMDIINLIPLDLNCILFANERLLEKFHANHNNTLMANVYKSAYRKRLAAMKKFMFNPETRRWSDFNITSGKFRDFPFDTATTSVADSFFYISDFSPIWYFDLSDSIATHFGRSLRKVDATAEENEDIAFDQELLDIKATQLEVIKSLLFDEGGRLKMATVFEGGDSSKPGIWKYAGGIPTSEVVSGQQWDFPNAWAPFQYYMIETLLNLCRQRDANQILMSGYDKTNLHYMQALEIANRWIRSTYCGWKKTNQFYEKYDVQSPGEAGHGGEYVVQEGFGWTNAVILMVLDRFGDELDIPKSCSLDGAIFSTDSTVSSQPDISVSNQPCMAPIKELPVINILRRKTISPFSSCRLSPRILRNYHWLSTL